MGEFRRAIGGTPVPIPVLHAADGGSGYLYCPLGRSLPPLSLVVRRGDPSNVSGLPTWFEVIAASRFAVPRCLFRWFRGGCRRWFGQAVGSRGTWPAWHRRRTRRCTGRPRKAGAATELGRSAAGG